jgi:hypothetical protein
MVFIIDNFDYRPIDNDYRSRLYRLIKNHPACSLLPPQVSIPLPPLDPSSGIRPVAVRCVHYLIGHRHQNSFSSILSSSASMTCHVGNLCTNSLILELISRITGQRIFQYPLSELWYQKRPLWSQNCPPLKPEMAPSRSRNALLPCHK